MYFKYIPMVYTAFHDCNFRSSHMVKNNTRFCIVLIFEKNHPIIIMNVLTYCTYKIIMIGSIYYTNISFNDFKVNIHNGFYGYHLNQRFPIPLGIPVVFPHDWEEYREERKLTTYSKYILHAISNLQSSELGIQTNT